MFGGEFRNTPMVQSEIENFLEEKELNSGEPASVSWVYAWYSRIVSKTVRETVRVLNEGREGTDLLHERRMEFFASIHSSRIEDPEFLDLLHYVYFTECRAVIESGRAIRDASLGGQVDHNISRYQSALRRVVNINPSVSRYLAGLRAWSPDIYDLVIAGDTRVDSLLYTFANEEGSVELPAEYQENFQRFQREMRNMPLTCSQVWDFSRVGLSLESKKIVDNLTRVAQDGTKGAVSDDTALDYEKLIHDVGRLIGINQGAQEVSITNFDNAQYNLDNMQQLYRVIATFLFRNEINQDMQSAFLHRFTNKFEAREVEAPGSFDIVDTDRVIVQKFEAREKSTMMTHASQLPYYQGLVLYFLGLTFPFFAVMLLIPGRHSGFLMWFGFYLWAKSWDIGFAIAMMLDDILFSMFEVAHNVNAIDNGLRDPDAIAQGIEISADAALAAHIAVELDPTFQLTTYYTIMGTVISAIPIVAAHLVLGGMQAGSGLIAQGMQNYTEHFSAAAYSATSGETTISNTARASYVMEQIMSKVAGNYQRSGGGQGAIGNTARRNFIPEQSALQTNLIPGMSMLDSQKQWGGLSKIRGGNAQIYGTAGAKQLLLASHVLKGVDGAVENEAISAAAKLGQKVTGRAAKDSVNTVNWSLKAYHGAGEHLVKRGHLVSRYNQENQLVGTIEVAYVAGPEGGEAVAEFGEKSFEQMVEFYAGAASDGLTAVEEALPKGPKAEKPSKFTFGLGDAATAAATAAGAKFLGGFFSSGSVEEKRKRDEQIDINFLGGYGFDSNIFSSPGVDENKEGEEEEEE